MSVLIQHLPPLEQILLNMQPTAIWRPLSSIFGWTVSPEVGGGREKLWLSDRSLLEGTGFILSTKHDNATSGPNSSHKTTLSSSLLRHLQDDAF